MQARSRRHHATPVLASRSDDPARTPTLVVPARTGAVVRCPVTGASQLAADCGSCAHFVGVRRLDDGGGAVTLHVCDVRG